MENVQQGFAFSVTVTELANAAEAAGGKGGLEALLGRLAEAIGHRDVAERRYVFMQAHLGLQSLAGASFAALKAAKDAKDTAGASEAAKAMEAYQAMAKAALMGHDRAAGVGAWYQSPGDARQASLRVLEKRKLLDYQGDVLGKKIAAPIVGAVDRMVEKVERMAKTVEDANRRVAAVEAANAARAAAEAEAEAKARGAAAAKATSKAA